MGTRGPLAGQENAGRPRRDGAGVVALPPPVLPSRPVAAPAPPVDLADAGRGLWGDVWRLAPWLDERHAPAVAEACRLADELAAYRRAVLEHGALIETVVVSPKGEAFTRLEANPAAREARRCGAQLVALLRELGMTPAAQARLGLTHMKARRLAGREEDEEP